MTTYTADDFRNARFARHPDGRAAARNADGSTGPWRTKISGQWTRRSDYIMPIDGWVPVQESRADVDPAPILDELAKAHGETHDAITRAEKAERIADNLAASEARLVQDLADMRDRAEKAERNAAHAASDAKGWMRTADNWQATAEEWEARALASDQPRPLTADDITDEMVERAQHKIQLRATRIPAETIRLALTAALTEPTRPEWTDLRDALAESWPEGINGADNDLIAQILAERGVRVTGVDG